MTSSRDRKPRGARRLGGEHALRFFARRAVARHEAGELQARVAVDHEHSIEARAPRGFDQQRDGDDDVGPARGLAARIGERADGRDA